MKDIMKCSCDVRNNIKMDSVLSCTVCLAFLSHNLSFSVLNSSWHLSQPVLGINKDWWEEGIEEKSEVFHFLQANSKATEKNKMPQRKIKVHTIFIDNQWMKQYLVSQLLLSHMIKHKKHMLQFSDFGFWFKQFCLKRGPNTHGL